MLGKLFIVGVGPGDPGLVTVKAARVLGSVSHVFVPLSKKGRKKVALEIAQEYIPADSVEVELVFPMLRNKDEVQTKYRENFQKIMTVLRQGHDAALITLGDPGTYSTAWPILNLIQEHAPDIEMEVVPGITSYAHAAARAAVRLVEGNETLSVVSANDSLERIESVIGASDTVVFLKTYKERPRLIELLKKRALLNSCIYIRRCGLAEEEIVYNMEHLPEEVDYLSMIILKSNDRSS